MQAGEKEMRKAFEDTTTRNVQACIEHGKATSKLVHELEAEVRGLAATVVTLHGELRGLRCQLAALLQERYQGGT